MVALRALVPLAGSLLLQVTAAAVAGKGKGKACPTVTTTIPYFGAKPTTTTLNTCAGTVTVVVETPFGHGKCSFTSSVPTVTMPSCPTTTPTTTSTSTSSTATPTPSGKPLQCIGEGYITAANRLLRYSLQTGQYAQIATIQASSGNVNAVGYNIRDNFLYAADGTSLVRVHVDGTIDTLRTIPADAFRGDVDGNNHYWMVAGNDILSIDLDQTRATYLETLSTTPFNSIGVSIFDFSFIPIAGPYLYSVGQDDATGSTSLVRFNMNTLAYELVANYPNIRTNNGFGEHFGVNTGFLYALDDNTGDLWRFPVPLNGAPAPIGQPQMIFSGGPTFSINDGARCSVNVLTA